MTTPWLAIVGIGEGGIDSLTPAARALVDAAEVLLGGHRHLAMVVDDGRERIPWPSPFDALIDEITARRGRRVCVLASGDPLCYGVGARIVTRFAPDEFVVMPSPSAFSLAAARLGWSLPDVECLTLHGRPLDILHPYLQPRARLLALCRDGHTPGQVAALLCARGFEPSRVVVLERLGGARERVVEGRAEDFAPGPLADLCSVAIECIPGSDPQVLARGPGLPDHVFRHDGQLTKQVVRAATLAALGPAPGQLLWDVGAGCGSVAIEWMRCAPHARALAIERRAGRRAMIEDNARALGTPGLEIIAGEAPAALAGLTAPDAVFIGGGASNSEILAACWERLGRGGRLVANAVTLEGGQALADTQARCGGGTLTRIAVAHGAAIGPYRALRPAMPVTQFAIIKPWS